MKSSLRCKFNHQGDRCKKATGHDFETAIDRDPVHVGNFIAWKNDGTIVLQMRAEAPKRNRRLNRMLRNINTQSLEPRVSIAMLTSAIQYLRGNRATS